MDKITIDAPPPVDDHFLPSTTTLPVAPQVEHVIVLVDGGCVQEIFDDNANPVDYSVIDQDCLEGGQCPTCWEYTEAKAENRKVELRNWLRKLANKLFKTEYYIYADTYDWCPNCEINWDDPPPIEVQIKAVKEDRGSI
jgi:hypothetical protein